MCSPPSITVSFPRRSPRIGNSTRRQSAMVTDDPASNMPARIPGPAPSPRIPSGTGPGEDGPGGRGEDQEVEAQALALDVVEVVLELLDRPAPRPAVPV